MRANDEIYDLGLLREYRELIKTIGHLRLLELNEDDKKKLSSAHTLEEEVRELRRIRDKLHKRA